MLLSRSRTRLAFTLILFLALLTACSTSGTGSTAGVDWSGDVSEFDFELFTLDAEQLRSAVEAIPEDPVSGVRAALYEQDVSIHPDGRVDRTYKWIYQIASDTALSGWGSTYVDWSPWYQNRPTMNIRVSNPDGSVFDMTEDDGIEESADNDDPLIFSNHKRIRLPYDGARVGSVVEEVLTITEHQPYFSGGYTSRMGFHRGVPLHISRIVVDHPDNMNVKTSVRGEIELETDSVVSDGRHRLLFEARNLPDYPDTEDYLPYDLDFWPGVGISTADDWASVNQAYASMVDDAVEIGSLSDVAAGLEGISTAESVENVVAWVREEVRYTGLFLGEKSIRPTGSGEVVSRGFGDCKDMSVLSVSLLRGMGIDADVALVRSGYDEDVDPDMPGLGLFNHAFFTVETGSGRLWIDPTALYNDYLIPPVSIQERWALIINPDTEGLVRIDSSAPEENRILNIGTITLMDEGAATWNGSIEYTGALADWYRGASSSVQDDEARGHFETWFENILKSGTLTRYDRTDPSLVNTPFRIDWTWENFGRSGTYDDIALLSLMPQMFVLSLPDLFLDAEMRNRTHPFHTTVPFIEEWDISIEPPPGYLPSNLPEDIDLEAGNISLSVVYTAMEDGTVKVNGRLHTGERLMSPQDYTEVVDAASELYSVDGEICYFENEGARLINEGRFSEGLTVYREVYTSNPDSIPAARRYADALLQAGMGRAARDLLTDALERDPGNSALHQALGNLLTYDLVGRYATGGWDRAGAIRELEAAVELDPENYAAQYNLAAVLEMNERGVYLGAGADLEEALSIYNLLYNGTGSEDALIDSIRVALVLGDTETIRAKGALLGEDENRRYYAFLADILESPPKKIADIARRLPTEYERRKFLTDAAPILVDLREYERSAVVTREAARGTSDVMNAESRAAFYETLMAADDDLAGTDAENLAFDFIVSLLDHGNDGSERLKGILSADMYQSAMGDDNVDFLELMSLVASISDTTGLSSGVVIDIIKAALEVEGDGGDDRGYTLHVVMEIAGQGDAFDLFADYDSVSGGLRIVGSVDDSVLLGLHMLRCLDEGRMDAARHLMEFLWQEDSAARDSLQPRYISRPADDDLRDAAVILASENGKEDVLALLNGLLASEPDDPFLMEVLGWGYLEADRYDEALEMGRRLESLDPDNNSAARLIMSSLNSKRDWDELEKVAERLIENGRESWLTHKPASDAAFGKGDWDRAEELLLELIDEYPGYAMGSYNTLSWMQLFREDMDNRAMEYIMKSLDAGGDYSSAILHTAAAVLGKLDRAEDAMAMLRESMNISGVKEPGSDDWLVLGYIAQSYNLPDVARDAFERVEYDSDPLASYWLAGKELD